MKQIFETNIFETNFFETNIFENNIFENRRLVFLPSIKLSSLNQIIEQTVSFSACDSYFSNIYFYILLRGSDSYSRKAVRVNHIFPIVIPNIFLVADNSYFCKTVNHISPFIRHTCLSDEGFSKN